jgi:hypothetical protein
MHPRMMIFHWHYGVLFYSVQISFRARNLWYWYAWESVWTLPLVIGLHMDIGKINSILISKDF